MRKKIRQNDVHFDFKETDMRYTFFLGFIFLLLTSNCEELFLNENSTATVTAVIEGDEFVIRNGLHFDIYFAAFDQETLAVIDWVPISTEDNKLKSGEVQVYSLDLIYGFEPGKTAIFFYWDKEITFINNFEIDQ